MKIEVDNRLKTENLRDELKRLTSQYRTLSTKERESISGKAIASQIKGIKMTLKKTEGPNEEVEVKKARIPKYIKIGSHKIMTPKEIVQVRNKVKGDSRVYTHYSDKRCSGVGIPIHLLKQASDKEEVIILLRIPKRKTGNTFAFSQDLKTVMSYRKWRLANAINLWVIGEATETEHQTVEEFIRSEIELPEGLTDDELKEQFLASEDPNLIVKDVNRLIHLYYQETINNENAVPNKHSKVAK